MIDTVNLADYIGFVEQRHYVWEQRQAGAPGPWARDPVLRANKFTNVFRVLDPGTQMVMSLASPELEPRDALMRCFLYRFTNRPEPWEALEEVLGLPTHHTLERTRVFWQGYRGALVRVIERGNRTQHQKKLFSGAYVIMPDPGSTGDKLDKVIGLTRRLFIPGPEDIVPDFMAARSQAERFAVLHRNRGVGPFMSMQILTDWGYTAQCGEDRENDFVVAGPGAIKGAKALGYTNPLKAIHEMHSLIQLGEYVPTLPGGRTPSYMDVQNTLCEFSKYVRYRDKGATARVYQPAHPGPQPAPHLPAHWRTS